MGWMIICPSSPPLYLMLLESDANREIGGFTMLPEEPVREAAAAATAAALERKN